MEIEMDEENEYTKELESDLLKDNILNQQVREKDKAGLRKGMRRGSKAVNKAANKLNKTIVQLGRELFDRRMNSTIRITDHLSISRLSITRSKTFNSRCRILESVDLCLYRSIDQYAFRRVDLFSHEVVTENHR
ncbi:hypothetical protein YC2023_076258 [Brassica napus]